MCCFEVLGTSKWRVTRAAWISAVYMHLYVGDVLECVEEIREVGWVRAVCEDACVS